MKCKNNKNLAKIGGKVRNSVTLYPQNCVSHPQKRDKGLWWSGKYIIVDFNNIDAETLDICEQYLPHPDQFFQLLQIKTGTRLPGRKSLIVFDEVQLYPKARATIKYPVKDGRYDYIETGSLVSIKKSYDSKHINPMTYWKKVKKQRIWRVIYHFRTPLFFLFRRCQILKK